MTDAYKGNCPWAEVRRLEDRVAELEQALTAIRDHSPAHPAPPVGGDCPECAIARQRRWPPSLQCEKHYCETDRWRNECNRATAAEQWDMRRIASNALRGVK